MFALLALKTAGEWLLSLLEKLPPWLFIVAAALAWGGVQHHHATQADAALVTVKAQAAKAQAAAVAEAESRTLEQQLNQRNLEISNELNKADAARTVAARAVSKRLQHAAITHAPSSSVDGALSSTACRSAGFAAVSVLSDSTRDALVELASDADAVTDQLRACQSYVRSVVLRAD